jgi:hypothetical protein
MSGMHAPPHHVTAAIVVIGVIVGVRRIVIVVVVIAVGCIEAKAQSCAREKSVTMESMVEMAAMEAVARETSVTKSAADHGRTAKATADCGCTETAASAHRRSMETASPKAGMEAPSSAVEAAAAEAASSRGDAWGQDADRGSGEHCYHHFARHNRVSLMKRAPRHVIVWASLIVDFDRWSTIQRGVRHMLPCGSRTACTPICDGPRCRGESFGA